MPPGISLAKESSAGPASKRVFTQPSIRAFAFAIRIVRIRAERLIMRYAQAEGGSAISLLLLYGDFSFNIHKTIAQILRAVATRAVLVPFRLLIRR